MSSTLSPWSTLLLLLIEKYRKIKIGNNFNNISIVSLKFIMKIITDIIDSMLVDNYYLIMRKVKSITSLLKSVISFHVHL